MFIIYILVDLSNATTGLFSGICKLYPSKNKATMSLIICIKYVFLFTSVLYLPVFFQGKRYSLKDNILYSYTDSRIRFQNRTRISFANNPSI